MNTYTYLLITMSLRKQNRNFEFHFRNLIEKFDCVLYNAYSDGISENFFNFVRTIFFFKISVLSLQRLFSYIETNL